MAKALVVRDDPVTGSKDSHKVKGSGTDTASGATVTTTWTGTFGYDGTVTDGLRDLVTIGGTPVAVDTSGSTLRSGHVADQASAYVPTVPTVPIPTTGTASFAGTVGPGTPSTGAGSSFVTVAGRAVLLDGDAFDTCGGEKGSGNSTVAAQGQSFVTAAE